VYEYESVCLLFLCFLIFLFSFSLSFFLLSSFFFLLQISLNFKQDLSFFFSMDEDKVKIVVIGDSGVGKTSLVHSLCHFEDMARSQQFIKSHTWTVGCHLDVAMFTHQRTNRQYFVEFWDVSGSARYEKSRYLFFSQANGIILVHDTTNRKSYTNLWKWVNEVLQRNGQHKKVQEQSDSFEIRITSETIGNNSDIIPVLLVGTKKDLLQKQNKVERKYTLAQEFNCESITLCTTNQEQLAQTQASFERFYTTVVDRCTKPRYFNHNSAYFNTSIGSNLSPTSSPSSSPSPALNNTTNTTVGNQTTSPGVSTLFGGSANRRNPLFSSKMN